MEGSRKPNKRNIRSSRSVRERTQRAVLPQRNLRSNTSTAEHRNLNSNRSLYYRQYQRQEELRNYLGNHSTNRGRGANNVTTNGNVRNATNDADINGAGPSGVSTNRNGNDDVIYSSESTDSDTSVTIDNDDSSDSDYCPRGQISNSVKRKAVCRKNKKKKTNHENNTSVNGSDSTSSEQDRSVINVRPFENVDVEVNRDRPTSPLISESGNTLEPPRLSHVMTEYFVQPPSPSRNERVNTQAILHLSRMLGYRTVQVPNGEPTSMPRLFAVFSENIGNEDISRPLTEIEKNRFTVMFKCKTFIDENCIICMHHYDIGQEIRALPCLHQFHRACIDEWLDNKNTCPTCRSNVVACGIHRN